MIVCSEHDCIIRYKIIIILPVMIVCYWI